MDDRELQPAGGDCREGSVGMKRIDLEHQGQLQDLTGKVHHLPCCIRHDGPCAVSDYFKPNKTGVVLDGLEVEEASFRGRRLRGATLQIPDGYCGYVVKKKGGSSDDNSIGWEASAKFQNVTYWNHDNHPSFNDAFARSFQWFNVADAVEFWLCYTSPFRQMLGLAAMLMESRVKCRGDPFFDYHSCRGEAES